MCLTVFIYFIYLFIVFSFVCTFSQRLPPSWLFPYHWFTDVSSCFILPVPSIHAERPEIYTNLVLIISDVLNGLVFHHLVWVF